MKYSNKFQKFMYGRYGPDELYNFLLKSYLVIFVINIFLKSSILRYLQLIIFFYMFFRFFSKKIYKRSDENVAFLKMKKNFLKPFKNIERNIKDKDHIYKKCSKCKKILKLQLPYKIGFKSAKCPNCGKKVKIFTLKYQKVEIIKNKVS